MAGCPVSWKSKEEQGKTWKSFSMFFLAFVTCLYVCKPIGVKSVLVLFPDALGHFWFQSAPIYTNRYHLSTKCPGALGDGTRTLLCQNDTCLDVLLTWEMNQKCLLVGGEHQDTFDSDRRTNIRTGNIWIESVLVRWERAPGHFYVKTALGWT